MPPGTLKCRNCGSNEIEEDNARGDAVCTNCGSVLEDSLIVSEVQFEEVGRGTAAIGQFVSSDSAGGATHFGYGKFQVGSCTESREVTIKKAKKEITHLSHQLQLNQHCIDTALNFFKMALTRHLTRGRKSSHIYAACVYITCRTEGTSHLLIDISDVQQICSYELGRTYLKLSNALCINIPSIDPCLYIMRFANKLQFGAKTHDVSMTALRIVQRMKKDSMHSGRRPTGLCGAALLIAARMHDFNRTIIDIVNTVKIHGTTLRKRLSEFADTPSSTLTLEEFMAVDLEAEQDPPAFKTARKKDRDRIKNLGEQELTDLQKEIDAFLERDMEKTQKNNFRKLSWLKDDFKTDDFEDIASNSFITEANLEALNKSINDDSKNPIEDEQSQQFISKGLKPDIEAMCRMSASEMEEVQAQRNAVENIDLVWNPDDDDDEINYYILTHEEAERKSKMWEQLHSEYLKEVKVKEERLAKEREEGKPEKRKRKPRKRPIGPSTSAGEAIEKMLQEKKISSKINYDILKTLTERATHESSLKNAELSSTINKIADPSNKKIKTEIGLSVVTESAIKDGNIQSDGKVIVETDADIADTDADGDAEPEAEPDQDKEYTSLKDMLHTREEDELFAYEEDYN